MPEQALQALCPSQRFGDYARLAGLRVQYERTPLVFSLPDVEPDGQEGVIDEVLKSRIPAISYKEYLQEIVQSHYRKVISFLIKNYGKAFELKEICAKLRFGLSSYEKLENMKQVRKMLEYIDAQIYTLILAPTGEYDCEGNEILLSGKFYYLKEPDYPALFSLID